MSEARQSIKRRAKGKYPRKTGAASIRARDPIVADLFRIAVEKNITIDFIATALDCSLTTVSNWRQGYTFPLSINLHNLAEVLGCRLNLEIIDDTKSKSAER